MESEHFHLVLPSHVIDAILRRERERTQRREERPQPRLELPLPPPSHRKAEGLGDDDPDRGFTVIEMF